MTQQPKMIQPAGGDRKPIVINLSPDADLLAKAQRRLMKARTRLLLEPKFVFWATCALHLRLRPLPGMCMMSPGMIGTNGDDLFYEPSWIVDGPWSDDELMGVVAHEVSHAVKGDLWRRGGREASKWNLACDARIDPELLRAGLKLPGHGSSAMTALLQNPANYGKSAEELYLKMPDPPAEDQSGEGEEGEGESEGGGYAEGDDPIAGDVQPDRGGKGNADSDGEAGASARQSAAERLADAERQQRRWEDIARQAAAVAQAQGHLPAGMEHLVRPIRPTLDPWSVIRRFVAMTRRDDYSFARQSRHAIWRGLTLPSLYSEGVGELVIGIDTSGSTAAVVPKFLGFLSAILSDVRPAKTWLLEVDAAVHHVTEFGPGDELPETVAVHGYGGTCMAPIWEWCHEQGVAPACALVLTDLIMTEDDLGEPQPWPVLWISSTKGRVAAWGETVELEP